MLVVLFSHLDKEEDVGGEEDAGRLRALENWGVLGGGGQAIS